jgi:hypothetical protein
LAQSFEILTFQTELEWKSFVMWLTDIHEIIFSSKNTFWDPSDLGFYF